MISPRWKPAGTAQGDLLPVGSGLERRVGLGAPGRGYVQHALNLGFGENQRRALRLAIGERGGVGHGQRIESEQRQWRRSVMVVDRTENVIEQFFARAKRGLRRRLGRDTENRPV